jgi:hypothetical protein
MKFVPLIAGCLALATLTPARATAQNPHTRSGFWLNFGLGAASYGCDGCGSRESGGAGSLSLGGTLSQHVNLGVGVNVWAKEVNGLDLVASTITAMIRFYPSATGGFYLTGGLGQGREQVSDGGTSLSESGLGLMLGLGIDIRIGRNLSLTPFWYGNAMSLDSGDSNFGQLGLGLTVH